MKILIILTIITSIIYLIYQAMIPEYIRAVNIQSQYCICTTDSDCQKCD